MIRKIIHIDENKCNGCALCVRACHESAIQLVNGKAKLIRDDYCDGLGDCLPVCPTDAITFEEREALAYDEIAVQANQAKTKAGGCPNAMSQILREHTPPTVSASASSALRQWPVQIKLVPVEAPYFDNANLLIAADCSAYAYAGFHAEFMQNRVTLIGCPKLDEGDYSEKLTAILQLNSIQSVTVVRMEVPCCAGIEHATQRAIQQSGKRIPSQTITLSVDGTIL